MNRVYLLRHAKSSWKEPALPDRDRPLAPRGRRAAKAIARHLREQAIDPDLVLCSPARRARETLERIEAAFERGAVRIEPGLYAASPDALLQFLRATPATAESVMLIGHNPGLQELALALAHPSPQREKLARKFPTAALATLELSASGWRSLEPGSAELIGFVRPRDIAT
jgi:phosphohistidine phosphatase